MLKRKNAYVVKRKKNVAGHAPKSMRYRVLSITSVQKSWVR
jgi:hypothetical protein